MNNALLFIAGLLVVVLAALFAVPTFVDWNGYRGVFEEEASKVLGRDVRVGGGVNLRLLPVPFVRFEKVRLADVTGQTGEPFVRAESFTMWLSVPAMLRGVLEASKVELDKPVLTLALDGEGGGNWSSIELRSADLPFVPQDVALRSVNLTDGALALYNADAQRVARIEGINGELSADGLRGPFRFKGLASWSGSERDIKFATTTLGADGVFHIKASIKDQQSPDSYLFDGMVEDLAGKPRVKGLLTAKLAVPGIEDVEPGAGDGNAPSSAAGRPIMDLKADIAADSAGAKLDNLSLSLVDAVEPQILTGGASAVWSKDPRVDIALQSKWLDLDRLSGAGAQSAQFARVRRLGAGLMKAVVGEGSAHAKIEIDQMKVGGETAGGLKIDAERAGGVLSLKEFKAGLPGGSRLEVMGEVKGSADSTEFSGFGFVRGTSLARIKDWAGKSGANLDIKADGAYAAEARITVSASRFEIDDATIDVTGTPITGALKISEGEPRSMEVTLESARIDTREFYPSTARAVERSLKSALGLDAKAEPGAATVLPENMKLRVLAGELVGTSETLHNVDITLHALPGEIVVPAAKFATAAGLELSVEGRIEEGEGVRTGTIGYVLSGRTREALADAARIFSLDGVVDASRLAVFANAKISGLVKIGARSPTSLDATVDGITGSADVKGFAEFDGGLSAWRSKQSRLALSVEAPSLMALKAFAGADVTISDASEDRPSRFRFESQGIVGDGAAARIEVTSSDLAVAYDAKVVWPEGGKIAASGSGSVNAGDTREALRLLGMAPAHGFAGTKGEGTFTLTREGDQWQIESRKIVLGLSNIAGRMTVTPAASGGPTAMSADLTADHVSLMALLGALTDAPPAIATNDAEALPAERSHWPSGLFNLAAVAALEGEIRLRFGVLDISGDLATRDGSMTIALSPGAIKVTSLTADAIGGKLEATLSLDKESNGVALKTSAKLANAELSKLMKAAKGQATIDIAADAKAQSPAGLIAVLTGSGTLSLDNAVLPAPNVGTAATVAEAVVQGAMPNEAENIAEAITAAMANAASDLGRREVKIKIADGAAKLDAIASQSADGHLSVETTVDLVSLGLTSSWFLSPSIKPLPPPSPPLPGWTPAADKGPLPPVVVAYAGHLDEFASLLPTIDVGEFHRELTARQIERNVEELERLRKMDAERARLETERRKALEKERAAAAAAAKAERAKARETQQPAAVPQSSGPPPAPQPPVPVDPAGAAAPSEPAASGAGTAVQGATPGDGASSTAGGAPAAPVAAQEGAATAQGPADATAVAPDGSKPVAPPAVPRTSATVPRPLPQRRSTAEEVMRALGGIP